MGTLKNSKGFSLVNILIAVALSAIGAAVVASMQYIITQNVTSIRNETELSFVESDLLKISSDESQCSRSFWTGTLPSTYSGAITNLNRINLGPTTILEVGAKISSTIVVNSIQFIPNSSTGSVAENYLKWDTDLRIQFTDISKLPAKTIVKTFPMLLITESATGLISSCGQKKIPTAAGDVISYGCDMSSSRSGSTATYQRSYRGTLYDVLVYASYNNGLIHDGGRSGRRDSGIFYCVRATSSPGPGGLIAACLTREACLWR